MWIPSVTALFSNAFLNPERVSMPDFDIDFSDERRDEIIEYVVEKIRRRPCGANRHASVPWPQGALLGCGARLGHPYSKVDQVAKLVPPIGVNITLDKAMKRFPLSSGRSMRATIKVRACGYGPKGRGMPRHASTHAAGCLSPTSR